MQKSPKETLVYTMQPGGGLEAVPSGYTVLGRVSYFQESVEPGLWQGSPHVAAHMVESAEQSFTEVWLTSAGSVASGERDGLAYAHDGSSLFCCFSVPAGPTYRDRVRAAYTSALELLEELGYPHMFRIWNMIGAINEDNKEGMEIYKDFCQGRAEAFESRIGPTRSLPAATGIGSLSEGVIVYLVSSRNPDVIHIDNSRQVPAYHYPKQYGPKSPSFSRATRDFRHDTIYVSGTASILGHRTQHVGDIEAQVDQTLDNIAHLIGHENLERHELEGKELKDLSHVKVYVREDAHMSTVRARCAEAFSAGTDIRYMNVDICRSDLLVEIEGIVTTA